jgi:Zn finger protein HypA/HybF involved in hydrogenase expression
MVDRPEITTWEFEKEADCYNCRKVAVQKVEIVPNQTAVICSNCGAERRYVIHGFYVADRMPDLDADKAKRKYDIWKFTKNAKCYNCLKQTDQEVTLDEYKGVVVCPSCLFTRIYKISVYKHT